VALAHPEIFFTLHHDGRRFTITATTLNNGSFIIGNNLTTPGTSEEDTTIINLARFVGSPSLPAKPVASSSFCKYRFIRDAYLNHAD